MKKREKKNIELVFARAYNTMLSKNPAMRSRAIINTNWQGRKYLCQRPAQKHLWVTKQRLRHRGVLVSGLTNPAYIRKVIDIVKQLKENNQ